jgi:hypothetical protein
MDFLGCRVSQSHLALNRRSWRRFRRKLVALKSAFESGEMTESELQPRAAALVAFTTAGGVSSFQFRRRVLQQLAVSGQKARIRTWGQALQTSNFAGAGHVTTGSVLAGEV